MDRYQAASDELYRQTHAHFGDTWRTWSDTERKAVTAIALAQIPQLVEKKSFLWTELIEDITDYGPELRGLKDGGTITENGENNWRITQGAFLWWLADEIKRAVRKKTGFEEWLCEQELDGVLTGRERKRMGQAAKKVGGLVGKGATTLIESLAKGFGEGLGKTAAGVS